MRASIVVSFALLTINTSIAHAQQVTPDWLRATGEVCGGALSAEMRGEISTGILKSLLGITAGGDGSLRIGDVRTLLQEFEDNDKREAYQDYTKCLLTVLNVVAAPAGTAPEEVVFDADFVPAEPEFVKSGQRFVMSQNQVVAINNMNLMLLLKGFQETRGTPRVILTISSLVGQKQYSETIYLAEAWHVANCSILPYEIDEARNRASIYLTCSD